MSYILDALKKSEIENNPEFATSLLGAEQKRSRQRMLTTLVGLVLLVNIGAIGWWFYSENISTKKPESETASVETATNSIEFEDPISSVPTTAASSGQPNAYEKPVPVATAQVPPIPKLAKTVQPGLRRVKLRALPGPDRQNFPALDFSTHIYAEDSDLRAVVVNNQRLQEGELIGNWELYEITETGVVIRYQGYLVEVPVLDSWDDF